MLEVIEFNGLFINIDKNKNIKSIDIEYGDLEKIFNELNENELELIINVAKCIVEYIQLIEKYDGDNIV